VIRLSKRSVSTRGPTWCDKGAVVAAVAGLVLMASSPLLAQPNTAPVSGASSPAGDGNTPAREGNIYDYRIHQPTAAEVSDAELAAGIGPPTSASTAEVEKEVEDLLNQADRLDRQSEEQDEGRR
jgi:hypothetical protein